MRTHQTVCTLGLITCILLILQLQASDAQGFFGGPRRLGGGSASKAISDGYERQYDLGPLGFSRGQTNSRVVNRNGGLRQVTDTNSITNDANIGGLDVGGTFTRTRSRGNGGFNGGVAQDFHIGNLGLGASLSPQNLRNGFGLRNNNGGSQLNLGPLSLDLNNNAHPHDNQKLTQANINAQGPNARANTNTNVEKSQHQFGGLGVTDTHSRTVGVGRSRNGQTSADVGNNGFQNSINQPGGRPFIGPFGGFFGGRNFQRVRRSNKNNVRQLRRPKRAISYIPYLYPVEKITENEAVAATETETANENAELIRIRRQFHGSGFHFPQDGFQQRPTAGGGRRKNRPGFNQQAGSNTHSNQNWNPNGFFQDNGASSIGSNLADDGSRGQISSANTNQMNQFFANGGFDKANNAQSQSLNFDPTQQQASNANAGTKHTKNKGSERLEATSGSQNTNNNPHGSSSNIANTNSALYQTGDTQGSDSDASSQSIYQGADGGTDSALTNSHTSSVKRPGFESNSASSNASSHSKGGKGANAVSNAANMGGAGGSFGDAGASGGGGGANAGSNTGNWNNNYGGWNQYPFWQEKHRAQHQQQRRDKQQQQRPYPPYILATRPIFVTHANRTQQYNITKQQEQQQQQQLRFQYQQKQHQQQHQQLQQNKQQQQQKSKYTNIATELSDLEPSIFTQQQFPPLKQVANDFNATLIEQFDTIDENEPQGRTFSFITDFINGLLYNCINPCTLEAYQQSRCCRNVLVAPLPPPPPPPQTCCAQIYPRPPIPPPGQPPLAQPPLLPPIAPPPLPTLRRSPPYIVPALTAPPLNCCVNCITYNFYGPPPCLRYGYGTIYGNFPSTTPNLLPSISGGVTLNIPPYAIG